MRSWEKGQHLADGKQVWLLPVTWWLEVAGWLAGTRLSPLPPSVGSAVSGSKAVAGEGASDTVSQSVSEGGREWEGNAAGTLCVCCSGRHSLHTHGAVITHIYTTDTRIADCLHTQDTGSQQGLHPAIIWIVEHQCDRMFILRRHCWIIKDFPLEIKCW